MSERKPRLKRDAISRARFFLKQARACPYRGEVSELEMFESYLEAAIIFGRVAVHRVKGAADRKTQSDPQLKSTVRTWWDSLLEDPAINFFRVERDFISKVAPPKVGQIERLSPLVSDEKPGPADTGDTFGSEEYGFGKAEERYYYEDPQTPATETVEKHLDSIEEIVRDAEQQFGTRTLQGRWD